MTDNENKFLDELHSLLYRYGVKIETDYGYYDDPDTYYFTVMGGNSIITMDDLKDKHS